MESSTILALSSGSLPSGVAVLRLSGPDALPAVAALCAGGLPPPRRLALRRLTDPGSGLLLDQALVAVFPAPASFTGEDCAELHIHGSRATLKALLDVLQAHPGVVLAGPGDFTRRAFENGKLDLTEVEGLGDLLAAETESQRRHALARLSGHLSRHLSEWRDTLLSLRAEIEARLDFSDESDVPDALPEDFSRQLDALAASLRESLAGYERGRLQREGFRIVIAGPPNAGKSSLLNSLAGSDLAIVTPEAGTTRDLREVAIDLGGQLVLLVDTAGLRETDSLAERAGVDRAQAAMEDADLILWLTAPDVISPPPEPRPSPPLWPIASKADLGQVTETGLSLSSRTGEGIPALISALAAHIETRVNADEPALVSHLRDRKALETALDHLESAQRSTDYDEVCAEDLRLAGTALARLVGEMDTEAVLDRLFAGFCIGK